MTWILYCLPVFAYIIGSLSFAWMAGKIKGVNLREHGSGNLGATNAGRVLGKQWFAIVFICDVLKGVIPVLAAHLLPAQFGIDIQGMAHQGLTIATAVGAIVGHIFTFFHGFKGGKAVATSLGVLLALLPLLAGALAGVWLVCWLIGAFIFKAGKSNAVGPASVVAALSAPAVRLLLTESPFGAGEILLTGFVCLLAVVVVVRHRSNIRQLFAGPQTS